MSEFENWVAQLEQGESLSFDQARQAAARIGSEDVPSEDKIRLLTALTRKGESADEIAGFAHTFRQMSLIQTGLPRQNEAIDVCGTGGDNSGTFNISTTVGFLLASLDVPVFKHGNRSITSKCGSADILEAIGWPLDPSPAERIRHLDRFRFTFFFAPSFHPAFKHIGPIRKQLAAQGQRTIFNILGPMLNPGLPPFQLIGVMGAEKVPLIAGALSQLGVNRGLVVHSELGNGKGLDEASTVGHNLIATAGNLTAPEVTDPNFGLPRGQFEELLGGDMQRNLTILEELSKGKIHGTLADTIALNTGLALWVAGRAKSPENGIEIASQHLRDGHLYLWLRSALA